KARLTEIESQQQAIVARKTISETRMASLGESEQKYRKELAEILPELERHRENLIRTATERFHLASLKPLGPESFAWSIMKTTGVYDNYWRTEEAALEKAKPATEDQKKNPAWQIERSYEIEAAVYGKLKGYPNHFITLYGTGAGQPQSDFFATADQALYVANGGAVASWCMPSSGNPADSMLKAENPKQAAEALYLGVLGRLPDEEETASVAQILTTANEKNRQTIARDLVWALITSPEYRFNH
ncbi:MAG: hypothetical protein RJA81_1614, partial [Planctomycetota bacterium]